MKIKTPAFKTPSLPKLPAIDFKGIAEDFKTLDPKDPGVWPLGPKVVILVGLFAALVAAGWWFGWNTQLESLETLRMQEDKLRKDWVERKRQAVNLEEYRKQLVDIDRSFGTLLKQLPNKAEMESLLVDINQAGLGRGLQFELFKPGAEGTKEFYAEMPITLKLTGSYHDLGAFVGDVAKLSRIVTLNDVELAPAAAGKDRKESADLLALSAVAKTFRYLDEEEIARQKREKDKAKAATAKGGKK